MKTLAITVIGVTAAFLALIAAYAIYGLWVPGRSATEPLPPLTSEERDLAARLKTHIVAVASEPHNVQHPTAIEKSAKEIEKAFRDLGFNPQSQRFETAGVPVRNIWVTIEPATPGSAARGLVVGAHYDSAGQSPGANDNGSGTASVIELARLLKDYKPRHTRIYLVAFVNEEAPYWGGPDQGAARFADLLLERGETIDGMLSLETLGWFSDVPGSQKYPAPFNLIYPNTGNFVAFVGMPGSRHFLHKVLAPFRRVTAVPTIGGIAPSFIDGIAWSDHKAFSDRGIPALMLTDTAPFRYPHYHRATDTPDKVDVETLARITLSLAATLRELAPK